MFFLQFSSLILNLANVDFEIWKLIHNFDEFLRGNNPQLYISISNSRLSPLPLVNDIRSAEITTLNKLDKLIDFFEILVSNDDRSTDNKINLIRVHSDFINRLVLLNILNTTGPKKHHMENQRSILQNIEF